MESVRVHVRLGGRDTTILLHPTLWRLLELRQGGRREARRWLEARLARLLGDVPRGGRVRPGITRWAVDIILSEVARPDLVEVLDAERYDDAHPGRQVPAPPPTTMGARKTHD